MADRIIARRARAGLALSLALLSTRTAAQPAELVPACETLVALRLLTAAAPDREAALVRIAGQPGCRAVPRIDIGAVAHRAMIGGAPFECLAVRGEPACLWITP